MYVHLTYVLLLPCLVPEVIVNDQLPYFDLTAVPGVMELERVEESNSGPIVIPNSIIYGDDVVDTVYVSIESP